MTIPAHDPLLAVTGRRLTAIRRIFYAVGGKLDESCGPIELRFENGTTLHLDAAADGQALAAKQESWVDPFVGELSAENQAFVERSGKWTGIDVTAKDPYRHLVGQPVLEAEPEVTGGKVTGVVLRTPAAALQARVRGDELYVTVSDR